jgi:hypothetical protein
MSVATYWLVAIYWCNTLLREWMSRWIFILFFILCAEKSFMFKRRRRSEWTDARNGEKCLNKRTKRWTRVFWRFIDIAHSETRLGKLCIIQMNLITFIIFFMTQICKHLTLNGCIQLEKTSSPFYGWHLSSGTMQFDCISR